MSGTIGGTWEVIEDLAHGMPEYGLKTIEFEVQCLSILLIGSMENPFNPAAYWQLDLNGGGNLSVTWDSPLFGVAHAQTARPAAFPYSQDMTGTWSVIVDIEEVFEISGGGFPVYGGASSDDWPEETNLTFSMQTVVGSRITATCTCGGITVTIAGTVNTAFQVNPVCALTIQANAKSDYGAPNSNSASLTGNITVAGVTTGVDGSLVHTGTDFSGTAGAGGVSASVTDAPGTTGPKAYVDAKYEMVSAACWPTRVANFSNVLRAMDTAYPVAIGVRYHGVPGAPGLDVDAGLSYSLSQRKFDCQAHFGDFNGNIFDTSPGNTVNEYNSVYCSLVTGPSTTAATLEGRGEDNRLWRVLQRGFYRNGASIQQAISATLDSGSDSAMGPSGSIVRTLSDYSSLFIGKSANGYRYLRLALTADAANSNATISIGTKEWAVTVQTSGTIDIDLLTPSNSMADTDDTDTKWPLPSEWGQLSGVNHVPQITIAGLDNGTNYSYNGATLRRDSTVHVWMLPEFQNWILEQPPIEIGSITSTTTVRRYLLCDTDAKQSLEIQDVVKVELSNGSISYGAVTIGVLVVGLNTGVSYPSDGWTGVDHCAPPGGCSGAIQDLNCFLNSDRDLMFLGGGGASHDNSGWTYWQNVDASSGVTAPVQMLFDQVLDWYGGIGDVFSFGGSGTGALELRGAAFLRGQSWGTVCSAEGPDSGVTVALELHSDHSAAGSGTTDVQGRYETGTAFGKGLKSYDTIAQTTTPYPKITRTFYSRKRHRAAFGVISRPINPFNFADRANLSNYHATGIVGSRAVYSRSTFQSYAGGWDVDRMTVARADAAHAISDLRVERLIHQTMAASFCLSLSDGTEPNAWRTISNDDGMSWSDPVLMIARGQRPTVAVGNDHAFQIEVYAAYVDNVDDEGVSLGTGGTLVACRRTTGQSLFSDPFTFVDNFGNPIAVILDTFHIQQSPDGTGRWMLHCNEFAASNTSHFESYDDMTSWIRVS